MRGTDLGFVHIEEQLGSGGMGTVYRGTVREETPAEAGLPAPGTTVAVKVLHPHLVGTGQFMNRFEREARAGSRVRHPNVVRIHHAGQARRGDDALLYLVMEFVEGQTLDAMRADLGRLPETLCRHIGREAARGLHAVHEAQIVHRDVKPGNILITRDEEVKLLDLGVALLQEESVRLSQTGQFVGSVQYAAPEQFSGEQTTMDGRADLYALGLVLYELATGQHPFEAQNIRGWITRHLTEEPRRPSDLNPALSPFFDELLLKLLAKNPAARFESASQAARVIEQGEEGLWWADRQSQLRMQRKSAWPRLPVARETAVHGRMGELARLNEAWRAARDGSASVILLLGEAGVGKTRLADALLRDLDHRGEEAHVLYGAYPPGGAATEYDAFVSAFRERFGGRDAESALSRYLEQTPRLVPAFAALLRGEPPPEGTDPLSRDALQTVFVHAARALANERPCLFIFDDLHFAPEEGRALFAALASALAETPSLILGLTRPVLPPAWMGELERLGHVGRLVLDRLDRDAMTAVLAEALDSTDVASDLLPRVESKAGGNPFFLFELLRSLREQGTLRKSEDGSWMASRASGPIEVPSTVRDLVTGRLAGLEQDDRELLDVAACCGMRFDPVLLGEALGLGRIPLLRQLGSIESRLGLIRSAGRTFVFDHHQVQEVLYEQLSAPLRAAYHAALLDALLARPELQELDEAEIDGDLSVQLCTHAFAADQGTRVAPLVAPAIERLAREHQTEAAINLGEQALAAKGVLGPAAQVKVRLRLADVMGLVGRRDDESALLEQALAMTDPEDPGPETGRPQHTAVLQRKAAWQLIVGQYREAQETAERALALAEDAGDDALVVRVLGTLGMVNWRLGNFDRASELHQRRRALARKVGDAVSEGEATGHLALLLYVMGRFEDSLALYESALELAAAGGRRRLIGVIHGNRGISLRQMGRFEEAEDACNKALQVAREIGDRRLESNVTGNLGNILTDLGRYMDSLRQQVRQRQMAREILDRRGEGIATLNTALTMLKLGRTADARRTIEEVVEIFEALGEKRGTCATWTALGDWSEQQGDLTSGAMYAKRGVDGLAAIGAESASTAVDYARMLLDLGKEDEPRQILDEALAGSGLEDKPAIRAYALALRARLPGGDAEAAVAAYEAHAAAMAHWVRMRTLKTLGEVTGDTAHLRAAKELAREALDRVPAEDAHRMRGEVPLLRDLLALPDDGAPETRTEVGA